jgi:hypothetical protein
MKRSMYTGSVKICSLKHDKKKNIVDEECEQIVKVGCFMATRASKYEALHARANVLMSKLDPGKQYRYYHTVCEVA